MRKGKCGNGDFQCWEWWHLPITPGSRLGNSKFQASLSFTVKLFAQRKNLKKLNFHIDYMLKQQHIGYIKLNEIY